MQLITKAFLLSSALFLFAGCSQAAGTIGGIGSSALNYPQATLSRVGTKTNTPTSTATSTNTWVPSNTPTIGPPPDLELFNVKVYPETFTERGQVYTLLGRIRNNTDKTMLIHGGITAFTFTFELWDYDERMKITGDDPYLHAIYEDETSYHNSYGQTMMNCILYPGEVGVLNFYTKSNRDDYILLETKPEYNGPLGFWYTYESFYETRPDLPLNLHPKAENIKFVRDQASFKFEYTIVGIPKKINKINYAHLDTWIILYNKDGNINNILYKQLNNLEGFDWTENYRVMGNTADTAKNYRFVSWTEMTQTMIDAVDHIEVLLEFTEGRICTTGNY